MPNGMGVIDPKFAKGDRKLKNTKHCTIPPNLEKMKSEKAFGIRKKIIFCVWERKREKGTTMKNMQKDAKT